MDGCPHRKSFDELLDDGDLDGASPVRVIPYIGPFFERRLRRLGFRSVDNLVQFFNRKTADEIYDGLSTLLQNPRRNTCLNDEYHVADFNVCAFASLRNLFRVLQQRRDDYRALHFRRKPTFPQLPPPVTRGSTSSRHCSCLGEGPCRANRTCRWQEDVCTPRLGPGFAGVANYPGQRSSNGENQEGLQYSNGWRTPGRTPQRRLPRVEPNRRSIRRTEEPIARRLRRRSIPRKFMRD
jgi:hypothetical protein